MERFGQFEILRPLGVGGMAETSLARRRGPDGFEQEVCLKRILPALGRDPAFVRAFQDEAKLAVRLIHPHVCRLYDFGATDGTWWMSMEYLDAGDLRSLLGALSTLGQPLPSELALLLAIDLASALHYAHGLRIDGRPAALVHRDISPSNVLVDANGHFKLADFGIAKAGSSAPVTQSGVVKGKVPYMAPEHARGEALDARADLWSLGVVLYEAVAGERPFRGAHDVETLLAITSGKRRPIAEAAPHTPGALQHVIEGLLEPDRARRIARAADVLDLLAATPPPANARMRLSALVERLGSAPQSVETDPGATAVTAATPAPLEDAAPWTLEPTDPGLARDGGTKTYGTATHAPREAPPEPRAASADEVTRTSTRMTLGAHDPAPARATEPMLAPPTGVRLAFARDVEDRGATRAETSEDRPGASVREGTRGTRKRGVAALAALAAVVVAGTLAARLEAPSRTANPGTAPSSAAPIAAATPSVPSPAPAAIEAASPGTTVFDRAPAREPDAPERTSDEGEDAPPAEHAVAPETEPTRSTADAPREAAARGASTAERATLEVTAVPYGAVWLDGRRVGEGRVVRRVTPGRHVVGAGTSEVFERVELDLAPGERRTVALRAVAR